MRSNLMACTLVGALLLAFAAPALALGPLGPEVSAELAVWNKYVWRGIIATDDPVLQPAAEVGFGGISLGVWANLELTDVNDSQTEFTEVDYTLAYGLKLPMVDLEAGLIHYAFPALDAFRLPPRPT